MGPGTRPRAQLSRPKQVHNLNVHHSEQATPSREPMRKTLYVFILCAPLIASAQLLPKGELFGGYSYVRAGYLPIQPVGTESLNGWNASLAYKPIRWVGLVADFGGTYGSSRSVGGFVGCPAFLC